MNQGRALFKLKSGKSGGVVGLACAGLLLSSLAAALFRNRLLSDMCPGLWRCRATTVISWPCPVLRPGVD